ncbi:MAG: hypothetical protein MZV70_47210 [Desulfobacterales bacterium]|nr:hypothetical protein [Desulfobacterales bacterium]
MVAFFSFEGEETLETATTGTLLSRHEKTIVSILEGEEGQAETLIEKLEDFPYPVALFNLSLKPVVWNRASIRYEEEYPVVTPIRKNGVTIGFLCADPKGADFPSKDRGGGIHPIEIWGWLLLLSTLLLVFFSEGPPIVPFSVMALTAVAIHPEAFSVQVAFAVVLYAKLRNFARCSRVFHVLFTGYAAVFALLYFTPEINHFQLYESIVSYRVFSSLCLMLVTLTLAAFCEETISSILFVFLLLPFSIPASLAIAFAYALKWLPMRIPLAAVITKALLFAVVLVVLGYADTFYKMKEFIRIVSSDAHTIETRAIRDLDGYLQLASGKNYRDLKDFIRSSGLYDSTYDFEAIHADAIGEIVEVLSRGLPETMNPTVTSALETIRMDSVVRRTASGQSIFRYGFLTLRISADFRNYPFLKPESTFGRNFLYLPGDTESTRYLSIEPPGALTVLGDISIVSLLILMIVLGPFVSRQSTSNDLFSENRDVLFHGFHASYVHCGCLELFSLSPDTRENENGFHERGRVFSSRHSGAGSGQPFGQPAQMDIDIASGVLPPLSRRDAPVFLRASLWRETSWTVIAISR